MNSNENSESKKFNIAINHKYFSDALIEFVTLIGNKSQCVIVSQLNEGDTVRFKQLCVLCKTLKEEFINFNENNQGKLIKKFYKFMTKNINKMYPNQSMTLFEDCENYIPIIPGLYIYLVIPYLSDDEKTKFWNLLYVMYISSVNMVSEINNNKLDDATVGIINEMKTKINSLGLMFEPFLGVNANGNEFNVNKMFENISYQPDDPMKILLSSMNLDSMLNFDEFNKQFQDLTEDDLEKTTNLITNMLGADSDTKDMCVQMIGDITQEFKNGGINDMNGIENIIKTITEKMNNSYDKKKLRNTAHKMSSFLKNGEENLKNIKDPNGNEIGKTVLNFFKNPNELTKMMSKLQQNK